jgi:hypothetical protein
LSPEKVNKKDFPSWPGEDPAIQSRKRSERLDARVKPAHEGKLFPESFFSRLPSWPGEDPAIQSEQHWIRIGPSGRPE